ncbi:transposable element Tcb1 transposase [Trichonephila clavipes]|nr:transposable element Tcb1 transposase [Trichonephila clavipes]
MEAGWPARRVARQLGRSDCVVRRRLAEGRLGSRRPSRVLPLTPTHRRRRLEWCRARGNWTTAEWNQIVFRDENLGSDDNRVRVWRSRGERFNPAFALLPHIAPTADVMVWGAISYNTRSPLVLIRGTITAQRYVHDILQTHVLPLMQRLPRAIFSARQCSASDGKVVTTLSPHCYYLSLACPIPRFVSNRAYLGTFGTASSSSLNEVEARLQQIWNEMFQDIIQNLYASMPDRIASCIRAKGASTGY